MQERHNRIGADMQAAEAPSCVRALDALLELGGELGAPNDILDGLRILGKSDPRRLVVVGAGVLKAGKSSLLNALMGKEGHFATGDARKTVANEEAAWGDYTFVDTPGIDSNDADEVEAEKTFASADLLLLVHSVNQGEYERFELDFLGRLARWFPDSEHRRRALVPVLTKIDMVGEDLAGIREACSRQWQEVVGTVPAFVATVSNTRCMKGVRESKSLLIEASGIPHLQQAIRQSGPELATAKYSLFRDRFGELSRTLGDWLVRETTRSRSEYDTRKAARAKRHRAFERDAKEVFAAVDGRCQAYREQHG